MVGKRIAGFLVLASIVSLFSGCGSSGQTAEKTSVDSKPVTLRMVVSGINFADEEFKDIMADPIHNKYPNITLELVRPGGQNGNIADQVASGNFPDIVFSATQSMNQFVDLQVPIPLNDILKRNNVDIGKFDSGAMNEIHSFSDKGQVYAIPFSVNFCALFYNKDIFDKFAVSYPKDGMTWDEVLELTKKVSRQENGVQYLALQAQSINNHIATQLSLPFVDPTTEKAVLNTDGWKKAFQLYQSIMSFPGIQGVNPTNAFLKDKTLAMFADYGAKVGQLEELYNQGVELNWDMASYPVYKDRPGVGLGFAAHVLMISAASPHKDEAFQVLNYLTSDEHQTMITRKGRITSLKDQKIRDAFGADLKSMKGKNVKAIFQTTLAPNPPSTKYDDIVSKDAAAAMNQVLKGQADINTALRSAEDKANQDIAAQKANGQ